MVALFEASCVEKYIDIEIKTIIFLIEKRIFFHFVFHALCALQDKALIVILYKVFHSEDIKYLI